MRVTAWALLALCAACAPLLDGDGCPRPCPAACAADCLPSGYCAVSRWRAGPEPLPVADGLRLALGDLPPAAPVVASSHWVLDFANRSSSIPWDYWVRIGALLPGDAQARPALDLAAFNAVAFPVLADWSADTATDAQGLLQLAFTFVGDGRPGRMEQWGTVILPGTEISARLVDPRPWVAAPPCR